MDEREPTVLSEWAFEKYLAFNREHWFDLQWFRKVQWDFWRLYILQREAEAELKFFTNKEYNSDVFFRSN